MSPSELYSWFDDNVEKLGFCRATTSLRCNVMPVNLFVEPEISLYAQKTKEEKGSRDFSI